MNNPVSFLIERYANGGWSLLENPKSRDEAERAFDKCVKRFPQWLIRYVEVHKAYRPEKEPS
jgi:hypothetical protein